MQVEIIRVFFLSTFCRRLGLKINVCSRLFFIAYAENMASFSIYLFTVVGLNIKRVNIYCWVSNVRISMFFFHTRNTLIPKVIAAQCSVQPWHDILDGWKYNSNLLQWCRVHGTNEFLIVQETKKKKRKFKKLLEN